MLAREAALKSVVMLKNNGVLPLRNDMALYFVTGVNATSVEALLGNYYGVNNNYVTILEGLCSKISTGSQLQYLPGCLLDRANVNPIDWTTGNASNADATIVVLGITGLIEGEEGESIASPNYGDRLDYNIPQNQIDFLEKLREKSTKPLIVVITGGSPMNLAEVHEIADAVLLVWYPGEEGGNAVASIIFGETSPSGKLPVTFPKSLDQLPAYEDYNMTGRTYRYMQAEPMYPFGFGLSYGKFEYSNITMSAPKIKKTQSVDVEATVTNTGKFASEEVVQLYITDIKASVRVPLFSLKGFKRIKLNAGEQQKVKFTITPDMLNIINEKGESILESGDFKISISGSLPGSRTEALGGPKAAEIILTVK
jgi:beta-glucosidase